MTDQALQRLAEQVAAAKHRGDLTSRQALSVMGQATFDAAQVDIGLSRPTRWRNYHRALAAVKERA